MYRILVRPILEYGAQVLIYRNYFISNNSRNSVAISELTAYAKQLENFQTQRLLNSPRHVPPTIVRLFAGVEPLAARLDILKLRYFWKLSKTKKISTSKMDFDIKGRDFLSSIKGFLHEVFNLCCKYNAIDIWHGRSRPKINPMRWIKKIVTNFNMSKDLSVGRKIECSFSAQFLRKPIDL